MSIERCLQVSSAIAKCESIESGPASHDPFSAFFVIKKIPTG